MASMTEDELLQIHEILLPYREKVSHTRYFNHLFEEGSIVGELSQPFITGLIKFIEIMDAKSCHQQTSLLLVQVKEGA
jgi:hypothetical protein